MGIYAVTGGATGIGAALVEQLRAANEKVIVVDIKKVHECMSAPVHKYISARLHHCTSALSKVLCAT